MRLKTLGLAMATALILSLPAAAENVTVVHGIPGTDLGLPEALTVDVAVDGACVAPGVSFTDVAGPLSLAPGLYQVDVSLAGADDPCTGTLLISQMLPIRFGEDVTAVAHLTTDGTILLSRFANDVRAVSPGNGRVIVRHLADAPAVDVLGRAVGSAGMELVTGLENPRQAKLELPADNYELGIRAPGPAFVGPIPLAVPADETTRVFAVGTLDTGSFTVIVQSIELD